MQSSLQNEVEATNGAANVAQNTAVLLAQRGIDVYFFAGAGSQEQEASTRTNSSLLRRMPAPRNQFFLQNSVYFSARFRAPAENNSAFLFIGRLSEEKGIRTFCEAVQNSGVHGVVIGDGFLRDELEHQYPEITFTGWLDQSQIREWFRKTRCLVFPSICYETFGLTALEANAYGIPVIAPSWSAASDNASFVYHSQTELEDMMRRVNSLDIKALSEKIYNNFDESITTNYADNLLKIYESPLA